MKTRITFPGRLLSLSLGMAMLCLLSACSVFGLGATPQGNASQTPTQVLQSAATAMQQLKSAHIAMNVGTTTNGGTTADQQNGTLSVQANGDQLFPNESSLHLSVGAMMGNNPTTFSEIVTGNKLYVQNNQGQWHVIDEGKLTGATFSTIQVSNYNNLLMLAQNANVTDHGQEALNGQTTRHLTVTFNGDALKTLLSATGQLGSLSMQQQQNLNQALSQIKLNSSALDLWIDTTSSYVSRLELKFSISSTNAGATNENASVDATIDYSKYN
ncbi:MAG TPA: DUF6612 family protein, partial [Ktedonobacteraceae bacterium]